MDSQNRADNFEIDRDFFTAETFVKLKAAKLWHGMAASNRKLARLLATARGRSLAALCGHLSPVAFPISSLCAPPHPNYRGCSYLGNLETANLPPRNRLKGCPDLWIFHHRLARPIPPGPLISIVITLSSITVFHRLFHQLKLNQVGLMRVEC